MATRAERRMVPTFFSSRCASSALLYACANPPLRCAKQIGGLQSPLRKDARCIGVLHLAHESCIQQKCDYVMFEWLSCPQS